MFLEISQNSRENICARVSFLEACNFIKNEALAQMISCEFYEISKNTFFAEDLRTTASVAFCKWWRHFFCWPQDIFESQLFENICNFRWKCGGFCKEKYLFILFIYSLFNVDHTVKNTVYKLFSYRKLLIYVNHLSKKPIYYVK